MARQNKLDKMRKNLFLAARRNIHDNFKDDPDAVRALRDQACWDTFGTEYKKLTCKQLQDIINALDVSSGHLNPEHVKPATATPKQVKLLRFYAIAVAIHYIDLDAHTITNEDTGEILCGETLRSWINERFERNGKWIPNNIFRILYNEYVNPHVHEYLIQGNYRKWVHNSKYFNFAELKADECQYLINRFKQIYNNIKMDNYASSLSTTPALN